MFRSGTFNPGTQHELTATLDVTWQALSGARRNMRVLDEDRARAEKSIKRLKEELEQAQRRSQEAADAVQALEKQLRESNEPRRALEESVKSAVSQSAELQQALNAEKAGSEDMRKQLAAAGNTINTLEKEFSDSEEQRRELEAQLEKARERQTSLEAEWRREIEDRKAQLATEEQLGAALQADVDLLHRAMEQIDSRLENPLADPFLTPAHKDRRVIWIGAGDFAECDLFEGYEMEGLAASDAQQALEILSGQGADGLITDITITGIDWLSDVRKRWPDLIIIVATGPADAHLAVDSSLCSLATTVLTQPYLHEDVVMAVRCAFLRKVLSSGAEALDVQRTPTRPRLLIAEDDEITRTLISTCLGERGYDTTCVQDGAAALEAVEAHDFDVLVTDILMPKMDGIELTAKAKKLKPRLPIIILSAAGDVNASLNAMRAGAYCYVPKPAEINELSLFIERAMLADRLERELRDQNALLDNRTNELEKALHELQELQEAVKLIATRRQSQPERARESA